MSENNNMTIVETLRLMAVGDTLEFGAEQANSVRSTASNYGFQWDRVYTTKVNREARTITVTRTK